MSTNITELAAKMREIHALLVGGKTKEIIEKAADALEAVQPSQAGGLSYAQRLDIVTNWFSDEADITRAMQMLTDFEQTSAAINAKESGK